LRVSPGFFATLALALAVGPIALTGAVLAAAAMHEGGHLLALRLCRVPVEGVRLGAFGAEIRAPGAARLSYGRELAVTLAGPAVNLLAAPLLAAVSLRADWAWGFLFAGVHLLLGLYNLLPVPPLDGSRALRLVTACCFGPTAGDAAADAAGLLFALALVALGAYLLLAADGGALLLIAALGLLWDAARQVGLAKRGTGV